MSISTFSILGFTFVSIAIFLLFRLFHFVTNRFTKKTKLKQLAQRTLFGFEFIIWIIFIYRTAEYSLETKPVLSFVMILLLVMIFLWAFWFVIKDYLAGLYIRASGRFKLKQYIAFDDIKAKIIGFANGYLILETADSDRIEIPYSKLFAKNIEYLSQSAEEELSIDIEIKSTKDEASFIKKLKSEILEIPWVNQKFEPQIKLVNSQGRSILKIKIMLLNKKYNKKMEKALTELM